MAGPVSIKNPQREQRAFQRRIAVAVALVGVAALVLAGRLFLLQVLETLYGITNNQLITTEVISKMHQVQDMQTQDLQQQMH